MAYTLDHYAYNIRNIARSGQGNSDDERLNIRQIRLWINAYRASGMFEATDYGKDIDPQYLQDLGVVPLVEVDKADSSCPAVEWGCKIMKVQLPKLIDFPNLRALDFVGKIDKVTSIDLNRANSSKYKAATKFGHLSNRAYQIGNNLYVKLVGDDIMMEYLNIRGVFENPEDVYQYATEGCDSKCYDPAVDEYPMPLRLYEFILRRILGTELKWSEQAVNDEINNARKENEMLR